ncbi:MAG TPA: cytochrome c oxidase subunit II [Ktedonobacter sp.]|nr:cytochrome c oxidase subunit II [Ktedonobacter sp.]HBE24072.1 cytochrome c oxidase subunit II [Ktedonobacter sp.]
MPIFRRMKHWGTIIPVVLLSSLLFTACGGNSPTILNPTGPVSVQEANLFWFILYVATFIFVLVEAVLIWSIFRYRERPNSPAPRQIHGNNTIEIIWTVVPSIFLFAVLAGTIYTMFNIQNISSTNGSFSQIRVSAVGHQWWWEFDYPNQHVINADTLYLPQGAVVTMDLKSNNVIHSFWIPSITGKTDVIPGHDNQKIFRADQVGEYRGECAEYCGTQHAHMNFNVIVLDTNAFNAWVSNEQQSAQNPTASLAQQGQKLFKGSGGCTGCHGIVGVNLDSFQAAKTSSGLEASALVGPNLTHFAERRLIAGGILIASDGHNWANDPACQLVNGQLANKDNCGLYQWLHDPQAVKPGNDMIISSLSDTQIYALIAYLQSLK